MCTLLTTAVSCGTHIMLVETLLVFLDFYISKTSNMKEFVSDVLNGEQALVS